MTRDIKYGVHKQPKNEREMRNNIKKLLIGVNEMEEERLKAF